MTAPEFLRFLLVEKFPKKTAVTSSLRARSIVVLNMVSEIAPDTRVIFCHAPDIYPESIVYRDGIIQKLRLSNVRIADNGQPGEAPDAPHHAEDILADVWGGGQVQSRQPLDRALAGFDCWISAVYHRPYGDTGVERVAEEGPLVRVDLLHGWNQETVHAYMADHGLPAHPNIQLKQPRPSLEGSEAVPTYHY